MRIAIDGRNLVHRKTGISRYFLDLCHGLSMRGHELSFYMPAEPHGDYDLSFAADCRQANFHSPISRVYWQNKVLPQWIKADNPDVFWGPAHRLPPRSGTSVPTVLTIHDLVWRQVPDTMRWLRRFGERLQMPRALRSADVICVNSNATFKELVSFYPDLEHKIRVVPPVLNPTSFDTPDPSILAREKIDGEYFLFVGTNEPRKNLARLVEAFAVTARHSTKKVLLVICGGQGWKTHDAMELASLHGVMDLVRIPGYVSDGELSALYQNALCLVAPSLHEGFGLPIIEANYFGTPAITSNVTAMPEVGGDAVILVDPQSISSIADALQSMIVDHELRQSLAARAKPNAMRFGMDTATAAMEAALVEAVKIPTGTTKAAGDYLPEGVVR